MKETIEIIVSCTFFLILAFILSLVLMTLQANFAVVFKGKPDLWDKRHDDSTPETSTAPPPPPEQTGQAQTE
jgi:hypothetical protein